MNTYKINYHNLSLIRQYQQWYNINIYTISIRIRDQNLHNLIFVSQQLYKISHLKISECIQDQSLYNINNYSMARITQYQ